MAMIERELRELGRLDLEDADRDPPLRTGDGRPDRAQDDREQDHRDAPRQPRPGLELAVSEQRQHRHADHADGAEQQLPVEEEAR